jgi:hypothetical protein
MPQSPVIQFLIHSAFCILHFLSPDAPTFLPDTPTFLPRAPTFLPDLIATSYGVA